MQEESSSEVSSPIYKIKPPQLPDQSLVSPLKEMLFLIPKDTYDVQESHGESEPGTPCQLPELSNIRMKKAAHTHKSMKVNVEKYFKLSQLEETQVIENELQDLLTLPAKSHSPKVSQLTIIVIAK